MKTSYSALQTYRECPLRYKAQYIDKMFTPQSIEAFLGTVLHSTFEYMMKPGTSLPSFDQVWKHFLKLWTENTVVDTQNDEQHIADARRMITSFYEKNKDSRDGVVSVEQYFTVPFEDHEVHGYIDRIDKEQDSEEYEIIDYKTGRFMPDESSLSSNLQLGIYALALRNQSPMFPPEKITTTLYYTRADKKMSYVPDKDDLDSVRATVLQTIGEIDKSTQSGIFDVKKNRFCDVCPMKKSCPAWR